ncbi:MAG TPA: [Fe-Fe] hydrogenase large subunit C-terminal domain-containing protein, partial [Candidatus Ozemobacteraceae bacterium]|nr:[Fe-Fe] hydrogenase large subunit C-terminal domain-containing protein [Candidatus Ozemobacteraceae bacterium]
PLVDAVLTFEELGAMLIAGRIDVATFPDGAPENPASPEGRGFAVQGGVTKAVQAFSAAGELVRPVSINGLSRVSLLQLKAFLKACPGNFIEVMACEGGCVAGAGVVGQAQVTAQKIKLLTETGTQKPPIDEKTFLHP